MRYFEDGQLGPTRVPNVTKIPLETGTIQKYILGNKQSVSTPWEIKTLFNWGTFRFRANFQGCKCSLHKSFNDWLEMERL